MLRHLLLMLLLSCCLVLSPLQSPHRSSACFVADDHDDAVVPPELLALLGASPHSSFPANQAWAALYYVSQREDSQPLPDAAEMERLARSNPVAFVEQCLHRYERTVHGYYCTFEKHELIDGKQHEREVIEVAFRERPFSVHMHWLEGMGRIRRALYVKGESDGLARLMPRYLGLVVRRDPDSKEARQTGRYSVKEFGLKKGTERVLDSWRGAERKGALSVEFLGKQTLPQAGGRLCWVLHRRYAYPEEEGITDLVLYYDKETWLQVGSVLRDQDGRVIAEYFFRDLRLNPDFAPEQFTDAALH